MQYEFQTNSGAAAARNRGAILAKADFLAFLDSDDLWLDEKLSLQMAAFEADPQLDMVFGHIKQFHSPELDEGIRKQIKIPKEVIAGRHVGTMLIKKDAFLRVGTFRADLEMGEFIDWYSRAMKLGLKSLMLSDVVMRRRLHKNNQGIYKREHRTEYVRVLKAALDRRKKGNT